MDLIFLYNTEEAAAAVRKAGFITDLSLPQGVVPATGDLLRIAAESGVIVLQISARVFHFEPGRPSPTTLSFRLDLVHDGLPAIRDLPG